MKKIRIIIGGGLGNQLFQYAFYTYLLENYPKASIKLDFFQYRYNAYHQGIEIQKIFKCNCYDTINRVEEFRKSRVRNKRYPTLLHTIKNKLLGYKTFYENCLDTVDKVEQVINCNNRIVMAGFYQNPLFISVIEQTLRGMVINHSTLGNQNDMLIEYLKGKVSVSIHIRRGDYLALTEYNAFNCATYYNNAISYFKNKFENAVFVFFSNDISWVKENLQTGKNAVYVDWNKNEDSFKDIILMSLCSHNIIANSSFSWWGAWLNKNPNKIVVSPKQWFRHRPSTDIVPHSWILI